MHNYRVISEVKPGGALVNIPVGANDVSVQPLGHTGLVRVTYLRPLDRVELEADEPNEGVAYVD